MGAGRKELEVVALGEVMESEFVQDNTVRRKIADLRLDRVDGYEGVVMKSRVVEKSRPGEPPEDLKDDSTNTERGCVTECGGGGVFVA